MSMLSTTLPAQVSDHAEAFSRVFRSYPDAVIEAPGRVNIIGEHVDYMGYGVLTCAAHLNAKIAVGCGNAVDKNFLSLANASHHIYPPKAFAELKDVCISKEKSDWTNYIICGLFGVLEFVAAKRDADKVGTLVLDPFQSDVANSIGCLSAVSIPPAIQILVGSDIPPAVGMSSSSALVVASVLTFSNILNVRMSPADVAVTSANCEKYVGTAGGGMDQATICLSEKGKAQLIDFNPLTAKFVTLPTTARFVVSNTYCPSPKAQHAATYFNLRVFECKIGLAIIAKKRQINVRMDPRLTLKSLQIAMDLSLEITRQAITDCLKEEPYTKVEITELLGAEAVERLMPSVGSEVWNRNTIFRPRQRLLHVVNETLRVETFTFLCTDFAAAHDNPEKASGNHSEEILLRKLGNLMDQSDESLTKLYECSCMELTSMTLACRSHGALGSRLMGAGWGGCVISLVESQNVKNFCQSINSIMGLSSVDTDSNVCSFPVEPADCAKVYALSPSLSL